MSATNAQLVLDAIYNDPGVTVAEIADEIGISEGRVRQSLVGLMRQGLVMPLGLNEGHRYVTTAKAEP